MERVLSIIGASAGIVSIIGFIYTIAWRLGRFSAKIESIGEKVDLLWEIYIIQPLLTSKKSVGLSAKNPVAEFPFTLTEKGEELIPAGLKSNIYELTRQIGKGSWQDVTAKVIHRIGVFNILKTAEEQNITFNEMIGVVTAYIVKIMKEV